MEWLPLIGSWEIGTQVALLLTLALLVLTVTCAIQSTSIRGPLTLASLLLLWGLGLVSVAGVTTAAQEPVPVSNVSVRGSEDMDKVTFRVREGERTGRLTLLGKREENTFRVLGFREQIEGGKNNDHRSWEIISFAGDREITILAPATDIRANGSWQEGRVEQEAILVTGKDYLLKYRFASFDSEWVYLQVAV